MHKSKLPKSTIEKIALASPNDTYGFWEKHKNKFHISSASFFSLCSGSPGQMRILLSMIRTLAKIPETAVGKEDFAALDAEAQKSPDYRSWKLAAIHNTPEHKEEVTKILNEADSKRAGGPEATVLAMSEVTRKVREIPLV